MTFTWNTQDKNNACSSVWWKMYYIWMLYKARDLLIETAVSRYACLKVIALCGT